MFRLFGAVALALFTACAHDQPTAPRISAADLAQVAGAGWTGALVYRDYSPPYGEVMLDVEADVTVAPQGLSLAIRYPNEPAANSTKTLRLSAGGTIFDREPVVERREEGGAVVVLTRGPCEDDGRSATCEHVYRFSEAELGLEKRVRFDGDAEFIRRNAYRLTR